MNARAHRPYLVAGRGPWLAVLLLSLLLSACRAHRGTTTASADIPVPALLFGANTPWSNNGDGILRYGDQLRDRSFQEASGAVWGQIKASGATVTFLGSGGDSTPAYAAVPYLELANGSSTPTCTYQALLDGRAGTSYTLSYSLKGVSGTPTVQVGLWDSLSTYNILASANQTASSSSWTRQTATLTVPAGTAPGLLYICNDSANTTVGVDEVRLIENGSTTPQVLASAVSAIQGLGVRALRWPGGTLANTMHWKRTVGATLQRGEVRSLSHWETAALGLGEFLDLCEQIGATPLVQVNVLDSPQDAADLVEYVLGDSSTTEGALRAANGRNAPWAMQYFEIGNEPATSYTDGTHYAQLAGAIAAAMQAKAAALGVNIQLLGVSEASFQLADWLSTSPLLADWNAEALAARAGLAGQVQLADGHFYSYFSTDSAESDRFQHVMSAGTVLSRTRSEKIDPATGALPLWITEYGTVLQDASNVIQTPYLVDRQSGLVLGDELLTMIAGHYPAAFAFNLAEAVGFGLLRDPGKWNLRPTGVMFQLLSPLAGGTLLNGATFDASPGGTFTVTTGIGNIPSGLSYPLVAGVAVRSGSTGPVRVVVINRDYNTAQQVTVTVPGFTGGTGTIYRYEGPLSDSNESTPGTVAVSTQTNAALSAPLVLTLKPHSLVRVDLP